MFLPLTSKNKILPSCDQTFVKSHFSRFFQFNYSSLCLNVRNAHIYSLKFLFSFRNPIVNVVPSKLNNNGSWNIITKLTFSKAVCPINIMDVNFLSQIIFYNVNNRLVRVFVILLIHSINKKTIPS